MFQGVLSFQTAVTLTVRFSEFLDHQLFVKAGKFYMQHTGEFLEKLETLGNIPFSATLITAGVVGSYLSISDDAGLQALYEKLEERTGKKNLSTTSVQIAGFILKNSLFSGNFWNSFWN